MAVVGARTVMIGRLALSAPYFRDLIGQTQSPATSWRVIAISHNLDTHSLLCLFLFSGVNTLQTHPVSRSIIALRIVKT
jgi:hypothetical protein